MNLLCIHQKLQGEWCSQLEIRQTWFTANRFICVVLNLWFPGLASRLFPQMFALKGFLFLIPIIFCITSQIAPREGSHYTQTITPLTNILEKVWVWTWEIALLVSQKPPNLLPLLCFPEICKELLWIPAMAGSHRSDRVMWSKHRCVCVCVSFVGR